MVDGWDEYGPLLAYGETPERKQLRACVESNPQLAFGSKYSLHIATPDDMERMWKHGAPLTGIYWIFGNQNMRSMTRSMRSGRLLYQK